MRSSSATISGGLATGSPRHRWTPSRLAPSTGEIRPEKRSREHSVHGSGSRRGRAFPARLHPKLTACSAATRGPSFCSREPGDEVGSRAKDVQTIPSTPERSPVRRQSYRRASTSLLRGVSVYNRRDMVDWKPPAPTVRAETAAHEGSECAWRRDRGLVLARRAHHGEHRQARRFWIRHSAGLRLVAGLDVGVAMDVLSVLSPFVFTLLDSVSLSLWRSDTSPTSACERVAGRRSRRAPFSSDFALARSLRHLCSRATPPISALGLELLPAAVLQRGAERPSRRANGTGDRMLRNRRPSSCTCPASLLARERRPPQAQKRLGALEATPRDPTAKGHLHVGVRPSPLSRACPREADLVPSAVEPACHSLPSVTPAWPFVQPGYSRCTGDPAAIRWGRRTSPGELATRPTITSKLTGCSRPATPRASS